MEKPASQIPAVKRLQTILILIAVVLFILYVAAAKYQFYDIYFLALFLLFCIVALAILVQKNKESLNYWSSIISKFADENNFILTSTQFTLPIISKRRGFEVKVWKGLYKQREFRIGLFSVLRSINPYENWEDYLIFVESPRKDKKIAPNEPELEFSAVFASSYFGVSDFSNEKILSKMDRICQVLDRLEKE
ncbi:hypothetical protein HY988_04865 [Candidatus Micrarchaeota archaeon]|nr:hypothetical protein [Candidatus Micrarchaeota archaeon]